MFETPFYALGLKFPTEVQCSKNFFTDLKTLRDSTYVKRTIVVFPEATKTNGRGILSFEDGMIEILLKALASNERVHTIRFDYEFEHCSPLNTTDPLGIKTALRLMTQVRNSMMIQFYFNLEEKMQEYPKKEDKYAFIRKTMMPRGKEYALKSNFRQHQEFLGYWFNT